MTEPILRAEKINKHFGGLHALQEVSLTIQPNEIYGLIGPNGAGKTTLFNVITGLYAANGGQLTFNRHSLLGFKPNQIAQLGIARTFQNIRLFANMTALENVMVGCHVRTKSGIFGAIVRPPATQKEEAAIRTKAFAMLDYVGISQHAEHIAKNLAYGDQRRLEIARALATEPALLALDEPAAGMNPTETAGLRELLEKIRSNGITILLIEHDVKLVMGLCDRVAVLDYGKKIAEGPPNQVKNDPKVIEAYLGTGAI